MLADDPASIREFELAVHGSTFGAPVLRPLREPMVVGDYVITWWLFVETGDHEAEPEALAAALRSFHRVMSSTIVPLSTPEDEARSTLDLAMDDRATEAMPDAARAAIVPVLQRATTLRTPGSS